MSMSAASHRDQGALWTLVGGAMVAVMAVSGLMGLGGALGALVEHHVWLLHGGSILTSGLGPLSHPNDPASGWPDAQVRRELPGPVVWWAIVLVLLAAAGAAAYFGYRWLKPSGRAGQGARGEGMATRREVREGLGAKSVRVDAQQTRPDAGRGTPVGELSLDLGRDVSTGEQLHGSLSATVLITGSQGSGKTSTLFIPELLKYPGPAVVTSTRADIYELTSHLRARRGPVYVLDPTGLLAEGVVGRTRWAIQDGCADPKTAIRRGRNMATAGGVGKGVTDASHWQESCAEVLRYYLHAAALGGSTAYDIDQWASRPEDPEPARALEREGAAPGWSRKFQAMQNLDPRERSSVWSSVRRALDFLADPSVLAACSPGGRSPSLDLARFVDQSATLYVVGSENDAAVLRPLVVAIADAVASAARERARRTPGRRPDPPVGMFLDELPQIAPLPNLPQLASTARGDGITLYLGCQSPSQLLDLYGTGGRATLMDAATALLVLPGMTDSHYAEEVSKLCGEREEETTSWTEGRDGHRSQTRSTRTVPVITVGDVRSLQAWHALLLYRGMKPIETELTPWFRRDVAADILAGGPAPSAARS